MDAITLIRLLWSLYLKVHPVRGLATYCIKCPRGLRRRAARFGILCDTWIGIIGSTSRLDDKVYSTERCGVASVYDLCRIYGQSILS